MTDLRKAQLVMKDILDYVVKICEENNLEYWLDCEILKYILLKNKNKGNKDIITYDWKMADYQVKFKYNDIFPLTKVKFEGTEYNAPKDIHLYLRTIYGDYMELPPKENQVCHNKEGFIFNEKYLKKWSEDENIIDNNCI